MSKDLRVTLRITEALDTWLGVEGDKRGLDKAAFARMLLFERMNRETIPTGLPALPPNSSLVRDMPLKPYAERPPWEETYPDSQEAPQMAADAPNVDDMVQSALDDAKAIPEPPQAEIEVRGSGVRPVRRPPVPYSKGIPGWIPQ